MIFNGYLYRCSSEGLRLVPKDEAECKNLARSLAEGRLDPAVEQAEQNASSKLGQFQDLVKNNKFLEKDYELEDDIWEEPDIEQPE